MAADDISKRNNLHVTRPPAPRHPNESFSRMFPRLPPYAPRTDEAREQTKKLSVNGGVIDALDLLTGPNQRFSIPLSISPNNPDNANMTAGVTFFWQF